MLGNSNRNEYSRWNHPTRTFGPTRSAQKIDRDRSLTGRATHLGVPDLFFVVIQVIEHRIFVVDLEDNRSWPAQSRGNQAQLFVGVRFDSESRSVEALGATTANLLLDPNLPT